MGTPSPYDEPEELVTGGVYAHVRNPMYLELLLCIGGQALLYKSALVLWYGIVLWLATHLRIIEYEEPHLVEKYGEVYEQYCERVPRWLPRFHRTITWTDGMFLIFNKTVSAFTVHTIRAVKSTQAASILWKSMHDELTYWTSDPERCQPPAAVGDERGEQPQHHWKQRWPNTHAHHREHRRPTHDDHQPDGGQWCQSFPNV